MKTMLKVLFVGLSLLLMGTSAVRAQSAADRAATITDWMKKNLKLSDDQVPKVTDINMKYATMMDSLAESTKTKQEKVQVAKQYDKSKDADLKAVLNDDQFKTYQKKKDEIKKQIKEQAKKQ